ncbi:putative phospholipid-binding protein MlaC precursor, partial [Haemophilus influenzae]
QQQA